MQITETRNEGLMRELQVIVPMGDLNQRFSQRLDEIKGQVEIKGFRRGKVPVSHLKKVYGRALMAEVLEKTIDETSRQALVDRKERPAMQPKVDLPQEKELIDKVFAGQADLSYKLAFEVLPDIVLADLGQIKVERLVAKVDEAEIDKAVATLAERNVTYVAEEGRAAQSGDRVTINFVGRIDGETFEGGTAEDVPVVLGQSSFIPGFEEGLAGVKAGEEKVVTATFPDGYAVETLKGKTAEFSVTVKEVARAENPAIDETFAKSLGADTVDKLRELVGQQIQRELDQASRAKLKRQLLDALDGAHGFPLPASLVDGEFEGIWGQLTADMARAGKTFAGEGKSEDEVRAEYRRIAERRVRLGLLIGDVGDKNAITVEQDELRRALIEQARRFPGQERMVYEYYEKTPGALAELRAPIFEDKVVDFLLGKVQPTERTVSREELLKPDDEATP